MKRYSWKMLGKVTNIFLIIFFTASVAQAFTFDIWQSGITLGQAEKLAAAEGILLQNYEVDTVPQYQKQYDAKLFKKAVVVRLYFTEIESQLYRIEIRWEKSLRDYEVNPLAENVASILKKKYGEGKEIKGTTSSYRNGTRCNDSISGTSIKSIKDIVSFYYSKKCELVVLSYCDDPLKKINEAWLKDENNDLDDAGKL